MIESLRGRAPRAALLVALVAAAGLCLGATTEAEPDSFYDFTLNRIDGTPERLAAYRGKVVLAVNVASKCGYTGQYEGLEALYQRYESKGLVVMGFPSNDFAGQEPGSNAEIAEFCRATWSVKFPMFEKIVVRRRRTAPALRLGSPPSPIPSAAPWRWNFQKVPGGPRRTGRGAVRARDRTRRRRPGRDDRGVACHAGDFGSREAGGRGSELGTRRHPRAVLPMQLRWRPWN